MTLTNPTVGQTVIVRSFNGTEPPESHIRTGDRVVITGVTEAEDGLPQVTIDADKSGDTWGLGWFDEVPAQPERPLIDFSGSSRATAREYAKDANSRVLTEDSQKVLRAAAAGKSVDAYDLNEAVLDAMRSATTRLGQSMARRALARKIAYLGHITQAVLENHADGLPVYSDTGVRSRKIEELKREVDHAGQVNQSLTRDLTDAREGLRAARNLWNEERGTLTMAASEERRRLCAEIDRLTEVERVAGVRDGLLAETVTERDALKATLGYALNLLDGTDAARVLGFYDGKTAEGGE